MEKRNRQIPPETLPPRSRKRQFLQPSSAIVYYSWWGVTDGAERFPLRHMSRTFTSRKKECMQRSGENSWVHTKVKTYGTEQTISTLKTQYRLPLNVGKKKIN